MALDKVDLSETLLVVTADHSHVLTMAGYPTRGNDIWGLVRSSDSRGRPEAEARRDALGLPYTTLSYANGPGYAGGPGSALFHGVHEQNYVYHALVEALGWNRAPR